MWGKQTEIQINNKQSGKPTKKQAKRQTHRHRSTDLQARPLPDFVDRRVSAAQQVRKLVRVTVRPPRVAPHVHQHRVNLERGKLPQDRVDGNLLPAEGACVWS